MGGTGMPQRAQRLQEDWRSRALRLLCVMAMSTMLAACGRCGDFVWSSLGPVGSLGPMGACHSDPPPPQ
jgi:hypothetical protein